MKNTVENLTRRPVTMIGNSGKSYHIPPRYVLELPALEVSGNNFVRKLEARNVLAVRAGDLREGIAGARNAGKRRDEARPAKPRPKEDNPKKPER